MNDAVWYFSKQKKYEKLPRTKDMTWFISLRFGLLRSKTCITKYFHKLALITRGILLNVDWIICLVDINYDLTR